LDIRNLKTTLGMTTLSCKTPEMGEKEMWVYLLADVLPRTLSFKHTLQLWQAWGGNPKQADDQENTDKLLALVAEQSVGNRPGRIESRAVKRRPKPYPLLTKTRALAKEQVKKHGHPKKIR